jgi:hypothetical protein
LAAPIQKLKQRLQATPTRDSKFEKGTDMRQLFRYNEPTRMDHVVHLSLGLAAVVAVICSLEATFDFCSRLVRIAEWIQSPSAVVSVPGERERNSFTNTACVEALFLDADQAPQTNLPVVAPAADRGVGSPASG